MPAARFKVPSSVTFLIARPAYLGPPQCPFLCVFAPKPIRHPGRWNSMSVHLGFYINPSQRLLPSPKTWRVSSNVPLFLLKTTSPNTMSLAAADFVICPPFEDMDDIRTPSSLSPVYYTLTARLSNDFMMHLETRLKADLNAYDKISPSKEIW